MNAIQSMWKNVPHLFVAGPMLLLAGQASAVMLNGQWNNTSFDSFGDLEIILNVSPPNYSVTFDAD